MKKWFAIAFLIGFGCNIQGQTKHVLFLGNSYTGVNNLPQLVYQLALSAGDTMIFDANTPGGCTFGEPPNAHTVLTTSLAKIGAQSWDFVILQEQSQIPTIPYYRDNSMHPGARQLNDSIHAHNPCARTMFYMTWGRQFGGQQCAGPYCSPAFVDFNQMQDSLETAYLRIADELGAYVSPVGVAWKAVLNDTSLILHQSDESHPNISGSYLAACVFYASIWQKSPVGLSYTAGLSPSLAAYFQQIASEVVLNRLEDWNIGTDIPLANFGADTQFNTTQFSDSSINATHWFWDFGDGHTDSVQHPVHTFDSAGVFSVMLIASNGCLSDTAWITVTTTLPVGVIFPEPASPCTLFPNPVSADGFKILGIGPGKIEYGIYDLYGKRIQSGVYSGNPIQTSQLPTGNYIIRFENDLHQKQNLRFSVIH